MCFSNDPEAKLEEKRKKRKKNFKYLQRNGENFSSS